MKRTEAIKILAKVKAIWFRQPTDDVTTAEWGDRLVETEYEDAVEAVNTYCDSGAGDPPTVGQIRLEASRIAQRKFEKRRAGQLKIEHIPTDEERARNKAFFHNLVAGLESKLQGRKPR